MPNLQYPSPMYKDVSSFESVPLSPASSINSSPSLSVRTISYYNVYGSRGMSPGSIHYGVPEWILSSLVETAPNGRPWEIHDLGTGDEITLYQPSYDPMKKKLCLTIKIQEPLQPLDCPPNPKWFSFWSVITSSEERCIIRVPIQWITSEASLMNALSKGIRECITNQPFKLGPLDLYDTFGFDESEVDEIRCIAEKRGIF
ncbi:hypothetical protein C0989_000734 [Termitomyces sp. Mn162]|nr:hypothetical protein C0989_000734 [Termitomyces sp. Mn162]